MKRMGFSVRSIVWAAGLGFIACTGYLNDDHLFEGEGSQDDQVASTKGGAGGNEDEKGGRTPGGGKKDDSGGGGGEGEGGNDTTPENEGNGGKGGRAGTSATGGGPIGSGGNQGGAGGMGTPGGGAGKTGTGGTAGTGGGTGGRGTAGNPGTGGVHGTGGTPGSGGTPGTGGTQGTGGQSVPNPPPITGGKQGWGSRYWDCCKPACGWKDKSSRPMKTCTMQNASQGNPDAQSSCNGGDSYMCWNAAPWAVSSTLSYGFAATNGADFVCGRCYQLQFTGTGHNGNNPNVQALSGKTMIVQITNTGGDVGGGQFDILIPGGGVGQFDACSKQWGIDRSQLGDQYGGFARTCNNQNSCTKGKCQTVFGSKPELLAGCNWFVDWFGGADNPNFMYKEIQCPAEISSRSGM